MNPSGPTPFASSPNASLAPGTIVLGRYKIQRLLGRGGMGTVYLAQHEQTERLVALKFLDATLSQNQEYVQRFRREARAAGRIRSENVVAIYDLDADTTHGGLVLVMEYLEGLTLHDMLLGGPLTTPKALSFARQLLEGLAAAHASNVIHRDLKPANLFIERSSSGAEKLKILDFGISKLNDKSEQELTRAGQAMGTVAYMAPEQIRGKSSGNDPRADLYAAGVCIFMMLTGRKPIDAEDTVHLLAAVLEQRPLTLSEATGQSFSVDLETFVARALAKNPDHRFQTATEMYEALLQSGRSVGYEPTSQINLAQIPSAFAPAEPSHSGMTGNFLASGATSAPTTIDLTGPAGLTGQVPAPMVSAATGSMTSVPAAVVTPTPSAIPSRKKPWMMIGAVTALVVVGAGVAVKTLSSSKSAPSTATAPAHVATSPTTSTATPPTTPTTKPVPPVVTPPPVVAKPTPPVVTPPPPTTNTVVAPTNPPAIGTATTNAGNVNTGTPTTAVVADAGTPATATTAPGTGPQANTTNPPTTPTPPDNTSRTRRTHRTNGHRTPHSAIVTDLPD